MLVTFTVPVTSLRWSWSRPVSESESSDEGHRSPTVYHPPLNRRRGNPHRGLSKGPFHPINTRRFFPDRITFHSLSLSMAELTVGVNPLGTYVLLRDKTFSVKSVYHWTCGEFLINRSGSFPWSQGSFLLWKGSGVSFCPCLSSRLDPDWLWLRLSFTSTERFAGNDRPDHESLSYLIVGT